MSRADDGGRRRLQLRSLCACTSPLGKLRAEASVQVDLRPAEEPPPGADDDGDHRNDHVVHHIIIEPLPYRDPTVEVPATHVISTSEYASTSPGESEALFQLGALQTTASTPAASKAAAREANEDTSTGSHSDLFEDGAGTRMHFAVRPVG